VPLDPGEILPEQLDPSRSIERLYIRMYSSTKARWFSGLFLIATCGFAVLHFLDSLWAPSIDLILHYAVVVRISQQWALPEDRGLEQLSVFPRNAHRLAAIVGKLSGSPLIGLQSVALAALAATWSGIALLFFALPRRMRWTAFGALAVLLLANRFFLHLELFGNELVGNYFYPQLVTQAAALLLIALVLYLERAGVPTVVGYLILGISVPVLQHFHLLPALEVLATLAFLVLLNLIDAKRKDRWNDFVWGLPVILASLALTVLNPLFEAVRRQSENNGLLRLTYTSNLTALAIECLIVIALSAGLIWQWTRMDVGEARAHGLTLKYLGLFGLAAATLCLAQIALLNLGNGSPYACKKYAFALNTVVILDIPLLLMPLIASIIRRLAGWRSAALDASVALIQPAFLGLFVFAGMFTVLPSPSARVITLSELVAAEHIVNAYEAAHPTDNPDKYDYAFGLFPVNNGYDYLITIGTLKVPRSENADDVLNGLPPGKPRKINRIFTREGSKPWDIPECRQQVLQDHIMVLDGACALAHIQESGATPSP
jgi:hypothetical protein